MGSKIILNDYEGIVKLDRNAFGVNCHLDGELSIGKDRYEKTVTGVLDTERLFADNNLNSESVRAVDIYFVADGECEYEVWGGCGVKKILNATAYDGWLVVPYKTVLDSLLTGFELTRVGDGVNSLCLNKIKIFADGKTLTLFDCQSYLHLLAHNRGVYDTLAAGLIGRKLNFVDGAFDLSALCKKLDLHRWDLLNVDLVLRSDSDCEYDVFCKLGNKFVCRKKSEKGEFCIPLIEIAKSGYTDFSLSLSHTVGLYKFFASDIEIKVEHV